MQWFWYFSHFWVCGHIPVFLPYVPKFGKYQNIRSKSALQPSLGIFLLAWKSEHFFPESIWTLTIHISQIFAKFLWRSGWTSCLKTTKTRKGPKNCLKTISISVCIILPVALYIFLLFLILCAAYCETMDHLPHIVNQCHWLSDDPETGVLFF